MPKRSLPTTELDIQHWTEPVLHEETRQALEAFQREGYLPPNYKPQTLKNIAKVERYWRRHCDHLKVHYKEHLVSEEPAAYMTFFDWMWKETNLGLKKEKRLQSYDVYCRGLNQYFNLFERRPMSDHVLEQIRRFLNQKFPSERKISRRAKQKNTLSIEEYGLFQRYWWKYSECYRSGNMIIQQSNIMLWSSITGTRPGILLPEAQDDSNTGNGKRKRQQDQGFISDVPQNLKGRPEGADGTKFFMHCDYMLPYCPILHVVVMAFRDNAFENERLTPDIIWRLKVPKRLPSLPLRWKKGKLRVPIHRREGLGYEDEITHYWFRRWAANQVNQKYVESERKRILGQSGNAVFEKHYQSSFITGLQEVVLARPSQAALYKEAKRIRNRDPLAPKDLSEEQLSFVAKDPRVLELRQRRIDLTNEIRSQAGTIEAAKESFPQLYEEHEQVCKKLMRVKKALKKEAKETIRNEYFDTMPNTEVDKQINKLLEGDSYDSAHEEGTEEEDWEPPTPSYKFEERMRIVEAFYGQDSETLEGDAALVRRIQVTKDMISLCGLSEPSRRGKKFNWDKHANVHEETAIVKAQEDLKIVNDNTNCPADVCIVCNQKISRINALRRHLITQHLKLISEDLGIYCTQPACKDTAAFHTMVQFLNHAANIHLYDINITQKQLARFGCTSSKSTCCPIQITERDCIFCTCKTREKSSFHSPEALNDHVQQHLQVFQDDDLIPCPDPYCRHSGLVLFGHNNFKNHVLEVHSY